MRQGLYRKSGREYQSNESPDHGRSQDRRITTGQVGSGPAPADFETISFFKCQTAGKVNKGTVIWLTKVYWK